MIAFGFASLSGLIAAFLLSHAAAHGDHGHQVPIAPPDADWATRHMAEEHHLSGWDAATLFTLHDFSGAGRWTPHDMRRMYGLADASAADVGEAQRARVEQAVLPLFDADGSGDVTRDEFVDAWERRGVRLPDLGFGPGHHGDEEYEYEIHHWEKYHAGEEQGSEDALVHPEDVAHVRHQLAAERKEEYWERNAVIEANIPAKFLREG